MQKKSRILVFSFFGVFIVIFSAFCAVVWYVDPFRLFHQPFMCKNQIYDDMRYNARWFIKSGDYDSIILGTSMLANTSAKEAAELLGGKFINISIWGSSLEQRAILMNYALQNRPLKKIITSFDRGSFAPNNILPDSIPTKYFDFLYKGDLDIFRIYFSTKHLNKIISLKCDRDMNLDMPSSWMEYGGEIIKQRFGGVNNWAKYYNSTETKNSFQMLSNAVAKKENGYEPKNILNINNFKKYKKDIDANLLKFAKEFPNTEFILIIPPYSMVCNSILSYTDDGHSILQKELVRYILEQNLKNIRFFSYDYEKFTYDVANYMDLGHYSPEINSKILELINNGYGELTINNLDAWWKKYDEEKNNYDFYKFYHDFKKAIEAQKAIDAKEM